MGKEGREAFEKQEHRLEFNGCESFYNWKMFSLNQPVSEIEKVLGKYDRRNDSSTVSTFYIWDEIGIRGISPYGTIDNPGREIVASIEVFYKFSLAGDESHGSPEFLLPTK